TNAQDDKGHQHHQRTFMRMIACGAVATMGVAMVALSVMGMVGVAMIGMPVIAVITMRIVYGMLDMLRLIPTRLAVKG
ncbi:hypothetical protein NL436_27560, partial [Klebsiella pneumoniae]|nr:hypothetical protein [Klebsiella pneumoniae]